MYRLTCSRCEWSGAGGLVYTCPKCGGALDVVHSLDVVAAGGFPGEGPGLWRYSALLAASANAGLVLGEGRTPLLKSRRIGPRLGLRELYFKCDHLNPTGSFKDREVAVGVSLAVHHGVKGCVTSSSGNAGASLAAYCARAGLGCVALVPAATPVGKVAQMLRHGCTLLLVGHASEDAEKYFMRLQFVQWLSQRWGWMPSITARRANPYMVEGAKTVAFEIGEDLGWSAPQAVFLPVGGGGLAGATWTGFRELVLLGRLPAQVPLIGVQAAGASTVSRAVMEGLAEVAPVRPTTDVSGIGAPLPYDAQWAVEALRRSGGGACEVSDAEIHAAAELLAREEGVYVEPAGAASVAGLMRWIRDGHTLSANTPVVCLMTGHGLKEVAPETSALKEQAAFAGAVALDIDDVGRAVRGEPSRTLARVLDQLDEMALAKGARGDAR